MKIVTAAEMRAIDRATSERFGVPSLTLMENAGAAVADFALTTYPATGRTGVICGKGNNAGDGFVVARRLHEAGRSVRLLLLCDPGELRGDAAVMFQQLPIRPAAARNPAELASEAAGAVFNADLLIDAILGTGFRPPVSELYARAIERLRACAAPVLAVDIPSGLDADAMGGASANGLIACASSTVTFTAPRPAHVFSGAEMGEISIAPIGSPAEAIDSDLNLELTTAADIWKLVAPRPADAHKGNFGHVLVIGGSLGKAGAAAMAGMAALRSGAGLVTVAVPRCILPAVAAFAPELMTEPLPETSAGTISLLASDTPALQRAIQRKTVLALGPGISRNEETAEVVRRIVSDFDVPIVLDADGLNAFENRGNELESSVLVLTPHPGEMARLTGAAVESGHRERIRLARDFARQHRATLVLKGHRTLIADPDGKIWVNPTGNAGMATGGMGDILTGLVAGLLAQEVAGKSDHDASSRTRAVAAAVYLHGLAGDLACVRQGEHSLIATDLLETLPEAFRRTRAAAREPVVRLHE